MELQVVYCTDSNYTKIMTVSIISLCENNPNFSAINIYCFEKDLTQDEKNNVCAIVEEYKRKITFISISDYCDKFRFWSQDKDIIFSRFLIPYILDIKKILYLDCDTIIVSDLEKLWKISVDGYANLGVLDTARVFAKQEAMLERDSYYFNSGVMIINCDEWKSKKIFEKMKKFEYEQNNVSVFGDQRLLNAISAKNTKIISPAYNLTSELLRFSYNKIIKIMQCNDFYSEKDIQEAIDNPVIIHFSGRSIDRPWFKNSNSIYKEKYRSYMKKYSFTDFPLWNDSIINVIKWKIKYMLPINLQVFISNLIKKIK